MLKLLFMSLLLQVSVAENSKDSLSLIKYINPLICTAGDHGQTDPSANVPFGMIKAGPDTDPTNHAGYDFNADKLIGFSQNRASGVGCRGVGGNLRIFPFVNSGECFAQMDKTTEIAEAGYYGITLKNKIKCEVTAARTSAVYRFTYPKTQQAGIQIDLRSAFTVFENEEHEIIDSRIVKGWIRCSNTCNLGSYKFYYYLTFEKEPVKIIDAEGKLNILFNTKPGEEILIKVSLSSVSEKEAENNLLCEIGSKSFEEVKKLAQQSWNDFCKVIEVESTDESLKTLFYTHLYHAAQNPFSIADVSGSYGGSDGKVYQSKNGVYYSGWSMWDTFRTQLPLISILYPDVYKNMMSSLYLLYKQGKSDDPTNTESFIHIRNEHSIPVLLDAYRKGLLEEPLEDILTNMVTEAEQIEMKSPDKILEACYDFWALSEIGRETGNEDIAELFAKRSLEYRNVWNEKFKAMNENSDIMHGDGLYEGTLWQYRWFVPYDFSWVINSIGGCKETAHQLDYFFDNNLFNIGNQPDIHVPFLYYELEQPWKSQKLVRDLLLEPTVNHYGTHQKWEQPYIGKIFRNHPEGYIKEMDDDAGTMSGWFCLAAIGIYPMNIGESEFYILPSVFDSVTINLNNGNQFKIRNVKKSEKDIYIQRVDYNNEKMKKNTVTYEQIIKGGTLVLMLGEEPDKNWVAE